MTSTTERTAELRERSDEAIWFDHAATGQPCGLDLSGQVGGEGTRVRHRA